MMEKDIDLDYALTIAVRAAKNADNVIKRFKDKELYIYRKEKQDILSEVDIEAENEIISTLKKHFPHHCFSSEEAGKGKRVNGVSNRYEWIIDPLDGTINFVSGLPFSSISIALQRNGKTILGVILNLFSDEIYTSIAGRGSFLNGKKLRVSERHELCDSVFSFMLTSHYDEKQIEKILQIVKRVAIVSRGLRLFVSQAIELAFIASGKLEGTLCIKSRGFM
jgi:myo-inositol-1(or 4)-monophosphatase